MELLAPAASTWACNSSILAFIKLMLVIIWSTLEDSKPVWQEILAQDLVLGSRNFVLHRLQYQVKSSNEIPLCLPIWVLPQPSQIASWHQTHRNELRGMDWILPTFLTLCPHLVHDLVSTSATAGPSSSTNAPSWINSSVTTWPIWVSPLPLAPLSR